MPTSGILHRVGLVRTGVAEERITSIIRMTRFGKLGTMFAVTTNAALVASYCYHCSQFIDSCHPDDVCDMFL
jgi:hypothetical protein